MTTETKNKLAEITAIIEEAQKEADSWDEHTMPEVYARRILELVTDPDAYVVRLPDGRVQWYDRLDRAEMDAEWGETVVYPVGLPMP